jgi:methyl-accepting chemotaxis protein
VERSANVAREVEGLTDASVNRVGGGSRPGDDGRKTMDDVVARVKSVADLIAEIRSATEEPFARLYSSRSNTERRVSIPHQMHLLGTACARSISQGASSAGNFLYVLNKRTYRKFNDDVKIKRSKWRKSFMSWAA